LRLQKPFPISYESGFARKRTAVTVHIRYAHLHYFRIMHSLPFQDPQLFRQRNRGVYQVGYPCHTLDQLKPCSDSSVYDLLNVGGFIRQMRLNPTGYGFTHCADRKDDFPDQNGGKQQPENNC